MKASSSGGAERVLGLPCAMDPRPLSMSERFVCVCLNVSRAWSSFSSALPPTFVQSIKLNLFLFLSSFFKQ